MTQVQRLYMYVTSLLEFPYTRVPGSSPSAKAQALGKLTKVESTCRQQAQLDATCDPCWYFREEEMMMQHNKGKYFSQL